MTQKQVVKLSLLTIITILLNTILYSKVGLGLRFSVSNPLLSAFLITEIIGNIVIFIYLAYRILISAQTTQIYTSKEFVTDKDYIDALEDCYSKKIFNNDIDMAIEQLDRLKKKYEMLTLILSQHFEPGSMTYDKFIGIINSSKVLFYKNLKKMITRISIFNEKEYKKQLDKNLKDDMTLEIYKEHITYVKEMGANNEVILQKLDALILEISKLDDCTEEQLIALESMKEIDELISKVKLYN